MMNTFDRLKIVTSLGCIQEIDTTKFVQTVSNGTQTMLKYQQKNPYTLNIKVDYLKAEVIIEFTGKILGKHYTKLISTTTIQECFQNIEALGFIKFKADEIMNSDVVACDVTKDVPIDNVPELNKYIRGHLKNYQRFKCYIANNRNLVLEKNVISHKCKKRIIIYDKEFEMNTTANRKYANQNNLEGAFNGKCRVELNLNSKQQIRSALGIENTKLTTVLNSEQNPITDFLQETVKTDAVQSNCSDWKSYERSLVLQDCNYDLEQVEAKIRSLHGKGTHIQPILEQFRKALFEQDSSKDVFTDLINKLS